MEIGRAPVQPVGAAGRGGQRLVALSPLVALVVVVGAAWAGRILPIDPGPATEPATVDALVSPRAGQPSLEPSLQPPPPASSRLDETIFPAAVLGLPVMTGAEVRSARALGRVGGGLLAVAGFMRNDALPITCPVVQLTLSRTFCHRLLGLFPDPHLDDRNGDVQSTTPFTARVLPGTPMPSLLSTESDLPGGTRIPVPAIAVGHFDDARAPVCGPGHDWCRDDFVVEQLVWAAGEWLPATLVTELAPSRVGDSGVPVSAPPVDSRRTADIVRWATARGPRILGQLLTTSRLLAVVDPPVALVITGHGPYNVIWYLRTVQPAATAGEADVAWTVIDDGTGLVVASSLIGS